MHIEGLRRWQIKMWLPDNEELSGLQNLAAIVVGC